MAGRRPGEAQPGEPTLALAPADPRGRGDEQERRQLEEEREERARGDHVAGRERRVDGQPVDARGRRERGDEVDGVDGAAVGAAAVRALDLDDPGLDRRHGDAAQEHERVRRRHEPRRHEADDPLRHARPEGRPGGRGEERREGRRREGLAGCGQAREGRRHGRVGAARGDLDDAEPAAGEVEHGRAAGTGLRRPAGERRGRRGIAGRARRRLPERRDEPLLAIGHAEAGRDRREAAERDEQGERDARRDERDAQAGAAVREREPEREAGHAPTACTAPSGAPRRPSTIVSSRSA